MPTRWIMTGLRGFAVAAAIALALVAGGPVGLVRALGTIALALAVVGMLWHTYLLRRYDPHAFGVLRYQAGAWIDRMRFALGARPQRVAWRATRCHSSESVSRARFSSARCGSPSARRSSRVTVSECAR